VATPKPVEAPAAATTQRDREALSRAERIKVMHDLLRNDVNGPQIIENMNPTEITGEKLFQATHSSRSEVNNTIVNPDGSVSENRYLYADAD
jgi:hypothetical protein